MITAILSRNDACLKLWVQNTPTMGNERPLTGRLKEWHIFDMNRCASPSYHGRTLHTEAARLPRSPSAVGLLQFAGRGNERADRRPIPSCWLAAEHSAHTRQVTGITFIVVCYRRIAGEARERRNASAVAGARALGACCLDLAFSPRIRKEGAPYGYPAAASTDSIILLCFPESPVSVSPADCVS